ncbi:MAG TPA: hypothetical protein VG326_08560 [Tepidisphaeraceae bacterium]|jgi:hypothetical protein|nr:hypothetical protein [Tepidisphaeraceae bacterium]
MSDTNNLPSASAPVPHVYDSYAGRAVRGLPPDVEQFAGVVRDGPASPGQGADYPDARYYVDRAIPQGEDNAPFSAAADALPGVKQTVTATNLAEMTAGTHLIAPGSAVQVFSIYRRGSGGGKQYVFNLAPATAVVVKLTADAGDGAYEGGILTGNASAGDGGSVAMPMGMSPGGAGSALILNVEEDELTGHRLTSPSYAQGVVCGRTADAPPRNIVMIRGGAGKTDSPTPVGSASDSSETANSTMWSRFTDGTPVTVFVATRVVYNPTGDKTIYAFVRQLSFDARGLLFAISGETRVTVDVTESCP